jgi:hypothetical protein
MEALECGEDGLRLKVCEGKGKWYRYGAAGGVHNDEYKGGWLED